ncbi:MAG: ACP phosphodiesterase [Gammaproteobacteria bacterium]
MNYLAHFYLSEDTPAAHAGSLMGDFVKGRLNGAYPSGIERAIRIHRAVDSFTDRDQTVLRSRRRIDPAYRLMRGIMVDVFYDHFLARHWSRFSEEPLESFTQRVYAALAEHRPYFADPLALVAARMADEDWLGSYRDIAGIEAILGRMSRRLSRPNRLAEGAAELRTHYRSLEQDFFEFLPRLERYTEQLYKRGWE